MVTSLEKKVKKSNLQKIILETAETAGFITLAVLAPKVLMGMKKLGFLTHKRQTESIKRSANSLIERGLLEYKNGQLVITRGGKRYLNKCLRLGDNKKLNQNKKWDKKWRVIIFDIPENRRFDRNNLRQSLISIGFMKLQDSVWVYPYNCEHLINLIKGDTKTGTDVLYMIVEAIENDQSIKKYFGLDKK